MNRSCLRTVRAFGQQWQLMLICLIVGCVALGADAQGIAVKDGEKIAFLGDSITQFGSESPSGYVRLVISGLAANGVKATPILAGISGHTSRDMIARIDRDVINKKPDWVTISCGVNDVWHGATGVAFEPYQKNMTEMVDKAQAAGIKVMILTSTMIGEDAQNANNQRLAQYNDFLRELAKEKNCLLADLNTQMQDEVKKRDGGKGQNVLTRDGVHMNPVGDRMMASGVLMGFGLDASQIEKANQAWLDIPKACVVDVKSAITLRQYDKLNTMAAEQHKSVSDLLNEAASKAVDDLVKSAGDTTLPTNQR